MPRSIQLTVPADRTDSLVSDLGSIDGLIGMRVVRGSSLAPPGDVIELEITTRGLPSLMRLLDRRGVGTDSGSSIVTSEVLSIVSASSATEVVNDVTESSWEEMELLIAREGNMTPNALVLMAAAGSLASIGMATDALHVVLAAMVIAPGFEPIARIALGAVTDSRAWRRGLVDTVRGYAVLLVGAAVTALMLSWWGHPPLGGEAAYLPAAALVIYWTTISGTALATSAIAAVAGAFLILTNRTVLTAGVMIGLSLVPAAALVSAGLVAGEFDVVVRAAVRWMLDASLVAGLAAAVFGWKRWRIHRRDMSL